MNLSTFQDLLDAAHRQPEPQRLLFVFARAELPERATAAQRERFDRMSDNERRRYLDDVERFDRRGSGSSMPDRRR